MQDIEDPSNLIGISSLVSKTKTDKKLDLDAIEKSIIGSSDIKEIAENDPAQEFRRTIRDLSNDTGINLDDGSGESGDESASGSEEESQSQYSSRSQSRSRSRSGSRSESQSGSSRSRSQSRSSYYSGSSRSYSESSRSRSQSRSRSRSQSRSKSSRYHRQLKKALDTYSGNRSEYDAENDEDIKAILLEDIDELISELEGGGVTLSKKLKKIGRKDSINKVKDVHRMLRRKYDRKRANTFGNELILAGAQGLEWVFDGKKKYGPYKPNLSGWSMTIRPKLRRMRYETSTIISEAMDHYQFGNWARVGIELVPSAFIYSRMKSDQHGKSNYTPDQMSEAYEDLRAFDT